ncbi:hypothetical protein Pflav_030730 [Phytohabitans flavus]|uniref:Oligopeptide transport permease C-like N-terminal domain-containing protein n=1 Tax=Phytohabitans flavus TaxID=1076124 RepID=A0A6F8XS59_9ACTN|nr:hypothetical protein [Phytohabitans flavus]BCB76663.1 hypothetical protein Pflav_030730 [Phytohabitans flavus]
MTAVATTLPAARRRPLRAALRRPSSAVAFAFLVLLVGCAIAAPVIAPHDPDAQELGNRFAGSA